MSLEATERAVIMVTYFTITNNGSVAATVQTPDGTVNLPANGGSEQFSSSGTYTVTASGATALTVVFSDGNIKVNKGKVGISGAEFTVSVKIA
ncbi:uncharacterized protein ARMOST_19620 [Armillaria ostoyae]|uniref:Uncharacterized protein n=1 Tax=Armillaria ostoyae TaxID=47428 RepID=A0A284S514_ARMOS|nr:uncharacterized protein ARMOST_19620 [Armillaria ostoyae]